MASAASRSGISGAVQTIASPWSRTPVTFSANGSGAASAAFWAGVLAAAGFGGLAGAAAAAGGFALAAGFRNQGLGENRAWGSAAKGSTLMPPLMPQAPRMRPTSIASSGQDGSSCRSSALIAGRCVRPGRKDRPAPSGGGGRRGADGLARGLVQQALDGGRRLGADALP